MLSLPPSVRLFIATQVVDGRKGPDSLLTLVRDVLGQDIFDGHLFVFFTRRRDRVRIVYWDRNGTAMWTKRLECGRFRFRAAGDDAVETPSMCERSRRPSSGSFSRALIWMALGGGHAGNLVDVPTATRDRLIG